MTNQNDFWSDYNRGAAGLPPREGAIYNMAERAGADAEQRRRDGQGVDGGGCAILILLPMLVIAAAALAIAAAMAALVALPAGAALKWLTARFSRGAEVSYRDAYTTSFIGLVAHLTITGGLGWLILSYGPTIWPVTHAVNWAASGIAIWSLEPHWILAVLAGLVLLQLPGIAAFAAILRKRLEAPYLGWKGAARGWLAGLVVLVIPTLALGVVTQLLIAYAEPADTNLENIAEFAAVSIGFVAALALAGGLILGLALMAFGGGLVRGGPVFTRAWFTGAIAMAIFGGTAAAAIFLFRDADPMLTILADMLGVGPGPMLSLPAASLGFLKLTVPGAIAGAAFVSGSLYAYRGLSGFLWASLIVTPIAIALFMGAVLGGIVAFG